MAKFQPGNKAAVGRRPKTTLLSKLRDAVNPAWDDIVRAVIEQAKAGDMQAVTILANRVARYRSRSAWRFNWTLTPR